MYSFVVLDDGGEALRDAEGARARTHQTDGPLLVFWVRLHPQSHARPLNGLFQPLRQEPLHPVGVPAWHSEK